MASITQVKTGWRAFVCVNGVRDSATLDTKNAAKLWAKRRENDLLSEAEAASHPCSDMFDRYYNEISFHKRGRRWEKMRIDKFAAHPIFQVPLSHITSEDIANWRNQRLQDQYRGATISKATVRREMNLLSNCFEIARREWKWIKENPCADVKKPPDSAARDRRISNEEIEMIRIALDWPCDQVATSKMQQVAVGFCFAIETAMRMSEICDLTHSNIQGAVAKLPLTKNGTARNVSLSKRALELLTFVPDLWVQTPKQFEATFRRGKDRTNIENLVFHDTRHEGITRLAKKIGVLDLARMTGHRDLKQLMTYYNESPEDIAKKLD